MGNNSGSWIDRMEDWANRVESWAEEVNASNAKFDNASFADVLDMLSGKGADRPGTTAGKMAGRTNFGASGARSAGGPGMAAKGSIPEAAAGFSSGNEEWYVMEDIDAEASYGIRGYYNAEEGHIDDAAAYGELAAERTRKTASNRVRSVSGAERRASFSAVGSTGAGSSGLTGGYGTAGTAATGMSRSAAAWSSTPPSVEEGGAATIAENGENRLQELLGGDFDLRRAVIEAEILNTKYF